MDPTAAPAQTDDPFGEKKPTSSKAAKAIAGCGGCGCALAVVALVCGAALAAWGSFVAPGGGLMALAVVAGFFGAALLGGGLVALIRARNKSR